MSRWLRTAAWMAPAMAMIAAPALADAVRLAITENDSGARLEARWADGRTGPPPTIDAAVSDGVLRLRFSDPVEVDVSGLQSSAPRTVALAAQEKNRRDVRIALRRQLDVQVGIAGGARIVQLGPMGAPASLQAPADEPPPRVAPPSEAEASVSVGLRDDFTRLVFHWPAPTTVIPLQNRDQLELRFNRASDIDIAELRASPPRFVKNAQLASRAGQNVRIVLTLDRGVRQRHFVDGAYTVVDLLPPPGAEAQAEDAPPPQFVPPRAPTSLSVVEEGLATRINVVFPTPARAAAFRRGESIWILFESGGRLDLNGVARAHRRHSDMIPVAADGMIGLRIPAPPEVQVAAHADGASWTFTLAARASSDAETAPVRRDMEVADRARLVAGFARPGAVKWIDDPDVGDRIGVALVAGPARRIAQRLATLEAQMAPTAQGALIEPRVEDINASFQGDELVVTRGSGLIAAAPPAAGQEQAPIDDAALSAAEGGSAVSPQVRANLDRLMAAAAAEGVEEGAKVDARMALARFLVRNDLAAEALGALRVAALNQPEIEIDPEFRLLRAASNLMMGRAQPAQGDLQASALADDPAAALWRGYAAALEENWEDARRELEKGRGADENYAPAWRARFALALAESALQLGDLPAAEEAARNAAAQGASAGLRARASLMLARVAAARGEAPRALAIYTEFARAPDEEVAVRAGLEAVRLKRARGQIQPRAAADTLEALRYRWRGDALEMDVIATLGDVYMEQGRWREAFEVMQVVSDRYPANPAARRLRADMTAAFERLFLDGEADRMEPIQAVGLFYQFSDLTPVGPSGDRIVRLLAGRLVKVDLLEQAARLLQHQVDERLEGIARAQVAAELAAIYLMDRKAEQAFQTINLTRAPGMPQQLMLERRLLEARALLDMGRTDHAIELVERDTSEDAQRVRAEAAWRARDWERAGLEMRRLLAGRDRSLPFTEEDRLVVLRAAIAMTMAGQDDNVRTLYREYAGEMAGSPQADAFEIVASGIHAEGVAVRDLARAVSQTDLLDRFLRRIRTRMTEGVAGSPGAPGRPSTPVPPEQAAPPPQQRQTTRPPGA